MELAPNLEREAKSNNFFLRVLETTKMQQLTVMCLQPGEDIGMETHQYTDQFIRIEEGEGVSVLNGVKMRLEDGSRVHIPMGTLHDIVNTSDTQPLRLYSVYSPPHHPPNALYRTKADEMKHDMAEKIALE